MIMILLDFPQQLLDHVKGWTSPQGFTTMLVLLIMVSNGSACEVPSRPQCFRRNSGQSVYLCEWSMNTSVSSVTYDLYFNTTDPSFIEKEFTGIDKNWEEVNEEALIKHRPVNIWVTAHIGSSSCTSSRTTVVLMNTVKYEAPQDISVSWFSNNLSLRWRAAEKEPAFVEMLYRREQDTAGSWETILTNTTNEPFMYQVRVNLQRRSAYQVQLRQKSTMAKNSLWSDWSPVQTVPAEMEHPPEVTLTTSKEFENGTRSLKLTWKAVPHAAAVGGVTYSVTDSQSSHKCPCSNMRKHINMSTTEFSTYVTNSAVNISVIAMNAAGASPPANVHVPAKPAKDFKTCDKLSMEGKVQKKTCLEWYELQDGETKPETVNILKAMEHYNKMKKKTKAYVRYFYSKHKCVNGIAQTVETCLFYVKEGAPRIKPQGFTAFSKTHNSAELMWKALPPADQQGFLTHFTVCSLKTSLQDEAEVCHNVSASQTEYRLENLTPGAIYNISLCGVTRGGSGPKATTSIFTKTEDSAAVLYGLLVGLCLALAMCTCLSNRIKNKIYPPVPTPVIPDTGNFQLENQEMLEMLEEVHKVTLHQIEDDSDQTPEGPGETVVLRLMRKTDDADEVEEERILGDSVTPEGTCDECFSTDYKCQELRRSRDLETTDLQQVENEITALIYRNGLVFDMKADSS